jgi:hypothetical protein
MKTHRLPRPLLLPSRRDTGPVQEVVSVDANDHPKFFPMTRDTATAQSLSSMRADNAYKSDICENSYARGGNPKNLQNLQKGVL